MDRGESWAGRDGGGELYSMRDSGLSQRRNGNPLQYSCLENPMDRGAWWATFHGVTESQIQLSTGLSDKVTPSRLEGREKATRSGGGGPRQEVTSAKSHSLGGNSWPCSRGSKDTRKGDRGTQAESDQGSDRGFANLGVDPGWMKF